MLLLRVVTWCGVPRRSSMGCRWLQTGRLLCCSLTQARKGLQGDLPQLLLLVRALLRLRQLLLLRLELVGSRA
jgi:hypothetical protein